MSITLHPQVKALWERENLEHLRYEYPLNEKSLVLDIGAHKGVFIDEIWRRYHPFIVGYEPERELADQLELKYFGKIKIYKKAVIGSPLQRDFITFISNDAFKTSPIEESVYIEYIISYITGHFQYRIDGDVRGFDIIDLIKINVEGAEYDILDSLSRISLEKIKNIQIQFHFTGNIPYDYSRRHRIQQSLSRTHELQWCYEFVWESWKLKE